MTRDEARTALSALVSATTPPVLSDTDLDAALTAARIPDSDGHAPVDDGYTETFDLNYAAAECMIMKATRAGVAGAGGLKQFTAEGATFVKGDQVADFLRLADLFRSQSTVGAAATGGIAVIELDPQTPDALLPRSAWPVLTDGLD